MEDTSGSEASSRMESTVSPASLYGFHQRYFLCGRFHTDAKSLDFWKACSTITAAESTHCRKATNVNNSLAAAWWPPPVVRTSTLNGGRGAGVDATSDSLNDCATPRQHCICFGAVTQPRNATNASATHQECAACARSRRRTPSTGSMRMRARSSSMPAPPAIARALAVWQAPRRPGLPRASLHEL